MTNPSNDTRPTEDAVFAAALKLPAAERPAYLEDVCRGDAALRARVIALLDAHNNADSLLDIESSTLVETEHSPTAGESVGQIIGRYKLLENLGEGGFGSVWAAEQREPVKRRVALKVIKLGMDTKQVVARFEAERQALALMDHPNISKVLDAGTTETGRPYFVMELVKGIPITRYCRQEKLNTEQRLDLFIKVCHAIQHAHQKGIIHRDIKPNNILVTLHDGVPVPKVIDFGIAKATQQELTELTIYTQHHQFIGTPAYMSPEQAEMSGLDIDTRSDIYSLGVLLYELLTGSTPFDTKELLHSGIDEMRKIIRECEPMRPSTRLSQTFSSAQAPNAAPLPAASLPSDLDWIVMKCLEKDRSRRYDTANGLAADLSRHLTNEPVVARPPTAAYRFQKAWRRNKGIYSGVTTVIVALLIGLGLAAWQTYIARIAKGKAVAAQHNEEAERKKADQKAEEADEQRERAEEMTQRLNENLYLSLVGQAQREVEANRPSDALRLLNDCADESLRGWEWHYVRNLCFSSATQSLDLRLQMSSLTLNHTGIKLALTLSPNGRDLAIMKDGQLKLWEIAGTGELSSHTALNADHRLNHLDLGLKACKFSHDGTQLAALTAKNAITIWDVGTGRELWSLAPQASPIVSLAFHPKEPEITTLSEDLCLRNWKTTASETDPLLTIQKAGPYNVLYSPDGKWLATGAWTYVRVFDSDTGEERCRLGPFDTPVGAVAISPDSRALVATDNTKIRIWSIPSGESLGVLEGHKAWLLTVAFSPDGTRLVSSGTDRQVKIWDWKKEQETLTLTGHSNAVSAVMFAPRGRIVSSDQDGMITLWDGSMKSDTAEEAITTLEAHSERVWSLAFTPEGRLVSCGEDSRGVVWDWTRQSPSPPFAGIFDVAVSTDGRYLLTAHGETAPGTSWEDGTQQDPYHVVRVLDAVSLAEIGKVVSTTGELLCAAMSPDGKWIAAGGYEKGTKRRLRVWEWRQSKEAKTLGTHDSGILDVVFSADGRHLASASEDGMVKLWDAERWEEPQEGRVLWPHSSVREILKIGFSPDGKRLATGDGSNDVVVIDVETGELAFPPLQGHGDIVVCVAFSPDGRFLASAGIDDTVRLWDARTGVFLQQYLGHTSAVNALAFSPDSRVLASGGSQGVIHLWRVDPKLR